MKPGIEFLYVYTQLFIYYTACTADTASIGGIISNRCKSKPYISSLLLFPPPPPIPLLCTQSLWNRKQKAFPPHILKRPSSLELHWCAPAPCHTAQHTVQTQTTHADTLASRSVNFLVSSIKALTFIFIFFFSFCGLSLCRLASQWTDCTSAGSKQGRPQLSTWKIACFLVQGRATPLFPRP